MKFRVAQLLVAAGLLSAGACVCAQAQSSEKDQYLFAYFKEPGNQGIYFALSADGYHYEPLNEGQPWVKPDKPEEVMRDVFITRGPDGMFHMVFTWAWRGHSLGYSESSDLLHWSPQTEVPIMANFPEMRNVWAPETDWDAKQHTWVLFWSSSRTDVADGNRIWASRTTDFKVFTTPAIFFDPGYEVIDATMFHGKDKEYLVFKDQTRDPLRYQVRYATGPTVQGPWSDIHAPITESWSEGPSALQVGNEFVIFYDHYRAPRARYEGVQSKDWVHWESINDSIAFPAASKHGSLLRVTAEEAARLRLRHDPVPAKDAVSPAPIP